jgi:hypothetical protein
MNAQVAMSEQGIAEQRRQFDAIQKLLAPFVAAGTGALTGQQDLVGLNGDAAQQKAIQALQASPQFTSMLKQGETSILQNASATGGLRGGNTQAALAQFSPSLLAATINDQYGRLSDITKLGANAAVGTGNFGQSSTENVTRLLGQISSAQAGGALAQGRAQAGYANAITSGLGAFLGMGGTFGGGMTIDPSGYGITPPNVFTPVRGGW